MEKIKDFEKAQLFIKGWAKHWEIRIKNIEIENDRYLGVEFCKHEAFSTRMVRELDEVFEYVLILHRCDLLCLAIYLT